MKKFLAVVGILFLIGLGALIAYRVKEKLTAKEEMKGHSEIASGVFETTYEDGSRTIVNYRPSVFDEMSLHIPPLGSVLETPGGEVRYFSFDETKGLSEIVR